MSNLIHFYPDAWVEDLILDLHKFLNSVKNRILILKRFYERNWISHFLNTKRVFLDQCSIIDKVFFSYLVCLSKSSKRKILVNGLKCWTRFLILGLRHCLSMTCHCLTWKILFSNKFLKYANIKLKKTFLVYFFSIW